MIPLFNVAMSQQDALDRVAGVLRSGRLEHGPIVTEFEGVLGERIGNPRVIALNSGSSGLHLGIDLAARSRSAEGRHGDEPGEVLSTPLTFEGTNWPILANGLRIRWVDVDPATLNIDLDDLERKISPATRAIVVVHWTGYPVDLNRLREILDRAEERFGFRPMVIEDCAQAWGATYRDLPLGNHGNICMFSFGALKQLTCGSGGMLVLPDDDLYEQARSRRWYGINRQADRMHGGYDVSEWGFRFYMNDIAAAIGLANLQLADELVERHRTNAAFYDKELSGVPGLEQTERAQDRQASFWVYPVKVSDRPSFMRKLADAGIVTSIISRRNDAHSCVDAMSTTLPGLDSVSDRVVYIPVGWWLSEGDRAHIAETIKAGW
ncbi:DegT/DnrJ/EryC1/StrS family aminotransferase [Actinospica durhamensis]|uniref:DegT/DnrJ/EryC1/StrS family aminotransferase n=1 Tax=Actinospica durhamensis TaxID=1508375 RepID=A0A941IKK3_9ACTN|nr:DegT/DnrJ/EryC1/StrS family aminotransferase [Actinospica durhamensis]MBR7831930.1 DegT/DnrJ/EryC1/StrS family aminotransferase [Actinospica durhamensis]